MKNDDFINAGIKTHRYLHYSILLLPIKQLSVLNHHPSSSGETRFCDSSISSPSSNSSYAPTPCLADHCYKHAISLSKHNIIKMRVATVLATLCAVFASSDAFVAPSRSATCIGRSVASALPKSSTLREYLL